MKPEISALGWLCGEGWCEKNQETKCFLALLATLRHPHYHYLAQDFDPFHTPHLPFHFWKLPKGQLISKASISLASEKLVLDAPLTLPKATILQALPPALAKSFLSLPHSNLLRMKGCAVVWPRTSPQSPSPSQQSQGHAAPPQSCASC